MRWNLQTSKARSNVHGYSILFIIRRCPLNDQLNSSNHQFNSQTWNTHICSCCPEFQKCTDDRIWNESRCTCVCPSSSPTRCGEIKPPEPPAQTGFLDVRVRVRYVWFITIAEGLCPLLSTPYFVGGCHKLEEIWTEGSIINWWGLRICKCWEKVGIRPETAW